MKYFEENKGKKVIIRSGKAGVYYGTLVDAEDSSVELSDAINLWYWAGASNLMQIAAEGVRTPQACKFTKTINNIVIMDVCEVLCCTKEACESIEGVEQWA